MLIRNRPLFRGNLSGLVLLLGLVAGLLTVGDSRAATEESAVDHSEEHAVAIFAGGCFWCMEPPFDEVDGVLSTTSGYAGGSAEDATYPRVSAGETDHIEVVRVRYDPRRVSYDELLDVFWRNIDPLDDGGQFCDRGAHYRSAIFARNEDQKAIARASLQELEESGRFDDLIVTEILPGAAFYPAEEYHQNYYRKNPLRYRFYRSRCGRDNRLEELWGK